MHGSLGFRRDGLGGEWNAEVGLVGSDGSTVVCTLRVRCSDGDMTLRPEVERRRTRLVGGGRITRRVMNTVRRTGVR